MGPPLDPDPCRHCALPVPAHRARAGDDSARFCCFGCRIAWELSRPAAGDGSSRPADTLQLRLGLGIFLAINVMVFSWPSYAAEWFGPQADSFSSLQGLFGYLVMFLCTGVVVLLGMPLAADALGRLLAPRGAGSLGARFDTNLLISIGVFAAYGLSVVHLVRGAGSLYFDTAAMILVLVTVGHWLEAGARLRATSSATALLTALPDRVHVWRDGQGVEIDAAELREGDRVRVRPGETVPVDGRVVSGTARLDESSLTGEASPRDVEEAGRVLAGAIDLDGQLWVEATRVGEGRAIEQMQQLLERARREKPPLQRLADRVAAVFVPAVALVALAVFGFHAATGRADRGLFDALSVLLISCPCALGLAAPLAAWTALRRAARRGVLVDGAVSLERAARVDRVFFDKTGTLTLPRPELRSIVTVDGLDETAVLTWAAAVEAASLHPLARAILEEAARRGIEPGATERARALPGLGAEAEVDGRTLRLGSLRLMQSLGLGEQAERMTGTDDGGTGTTVYLADDESVLAAFVLSEALRTDAKETVDELAGLGVRSGILTGDREAAALSVAGKLGIPARHDLLPADKLTLLGQARERGACVAMVGDGLNDGPVLAAADVGIAVGSATDLARQAGNVHLFGERLDRVPWLLRLARDAHRRVRFALGWAFAYNSVGIGLALSGRLTPIFAATAMFVSSLVVIVVCRGAGKRIMPNGEPTDASTIDANSATVGSAFSAESRS